MMGYASQMKGYWGSVAPVCDRKCPSNCANDTIDYGAQCDSITGECGKCRSGYAGPHCSQDIFLHYSCMRSLEWVLDQIKGLASSCDEASVAAFDACLSVPAAYSAPSLGAPLCFGLTSALKKVCSSRCGSESTCNWTDVVTWPPQQRQDIMARTCEITHAFGVGTRWERQSHVSHDRFASVSVPKPPAKADTDGKANTDRKADTDRKNTISLQTTPTATPIPLPAWPTDVALSFSVLVPSNSTLTSQLYWQASRDLFYAKTVTGSSETTEIFLNCSSDQTAFRSANGSCYVSLGIGCYPKSQPNPLLRFLAALGVSQPVFTLKGSLPCEDGSGVCVWWQVNDTVLYYERNATRTPTKIEIYDVGRAGTASASPLFVFLVQSFASPGPQLESLVSSALRNCSDAATTSGLASAASGAFSSSSSAYSASLSSSSASAMAGFSTASGSGTSSGESGCSPSYSSLIAVLVMLTAVLLSPPR